MPVVVGPLAPEAFDAIAAIAADRGAEMIRAHEGVRIERPRETPTGQQFFLETPGHAYGEISLGLHGRHQLTNAVVAVRLLEQLTRMGVPTSPRAIASGLARVQWPGRLQRIELGDGRELLLDAAHNPAGARALARYLAAQEHERPLVFAAMRDKDAEGMLSPLMPVIGGAIVLTRAPTRRSADPAALAETVARLDPTMPVAIEEAPAAALARAWRVDSHVTVAGSIFLLGEVLRELRRS